MFKSINEMSCSGHRNCDGYNYGIHKQIAIGWWKSKILNEDDNLLLEEIPNVGKKYLINVDFSTAKSAEYYKEKILIYYNSHKIMVWDDASIAGGEYTQENNIAICLCNFNKIVNEFSYGTTIEVEVEKIYTLADLPDFEINETLPQHWEELLTYYTEITVTKKGAYYYLKLTDGGNMLFDFVCKKKAKKIIIILIRDDELACKEQIIIGNYFAPTQFIKIIQEKFPEDF